MGTLLLYFLFWLMSLGQVQGHELPQEIIRPGYGAVMKPMGNLIVSPQVLTLNFILPFDLKRPEIPELNFRIIEICQAQQATETPENKYIKTICDYQMPGIRHSLNISKMWSQRLEDLRQDFVDLRSTARQNYGGNVRRKRGVAAWIFSNFGWVLGQGIKTLMQLKRDRDLKKGLKMLANHQKMQDREILFLKQDLANYIKLDLKQQSALQARISIAEASLKNIGTQLNSLVYAVNRTVSKLDRQIIAVPALSRLVALRAHLDSLAFGILPSIYYSEMGLLRNLRDAERGTLKHGLIAENVLKRALREARIELKEWEVGYDLITTSVEHLYLNSRVRVVVKQEGAVVQIPLEVMKRNTPFLQLFNTYTVPVPLDGNGSLASKLDLPGSYLAISNKYHITLTKEEIAACHSVGQMQLTICPLTLPLIKRERPSCLSAIYDDDKADVFGHCPIILNTLTKFGPQVIETSQDLLIFGMKTEHELWCQHDNQPAPLNRLTYSIVPKKYLCQCNIFANEYFLQGYLCNDSQAINFELQHPTNGLTTILTADIVQSLKVLNADMGVWDQVEPLLVDVIEHEFAVNVVPEQDLHVGDIKEKLQQKLESEILENERSAPKAVAFDSWFGGQLWFLGMTLILSIIGSVGMVWACYNYCQHQKLGTIVAAGLLNSAQPAYALNAVGSQCGGQFDYVNLLVQAASTLLLAIISYCILGLFRRLMQQGLRRSIPNLNPEMFFGYPKVTLLLELISGTERILLPFAYVNGMINEICFLGQLQLKILGFRGSICGGALALHLDGGTSTGQLRCGTTQMKMPDIVPVLWQKVWVVRRMSRSQYKAAIWLWDQYGIAYPLKDEFEVNPGALMNYLSH